MFISPPSPSFDRAFQAQQAIGIHAVNRLKVRISLDDATAHASIDDVRLYDYALTPDEIAAIPGSAPVLSGVEGGVSPAEIPLLGGVGVGSPGSAPVLGEVEGGILLAPEADTTSTETSFPGEGGGEVTAIKYYYVNGLRVARERDGEFTWIHADHLHSATRITDVNGLEIRRLAYTSFGEEAENTGTGDSPKYQYTGKEPDATGLYDYGARYYDPVLCRFITPDTIYDMGPQGLNRYSYVLNNPIKYRDPKGKNVVVVTGGIKKKEVWAKKYWLGRWVVACNYSEDFRLFSATVSYESSVFPFIKRLRHYSYPPPKPSLIDQIL